MSKHTPERWTLRTHLGTEGEEDRYLYPFEFRIPNCISDRNARLIAAAPEMLELLRKVANYKPVSLFRDDAIALLARIDGDEEAAK